MIDRTGRIKNDRSDKAGPPEHVRNNGQYSEDPAGRWGGDKRIDETKVAFVSANIKRAVC